MYVSLLFNIYYKTIFKNIEYHSENLVWWEFLMFLKVFFILNRAAFIWSKHSKSCKIVKYYYNLK